MAEKTTTQIAASNPRLQSIDMLRGVAILLVIAFHLPNYAPGGWRENPWFFPSFLAGFGYLGVPLFIVISGFCIHRAAATTRAQSGTYKFDWGQFWKRRFIRLYPPYVAAMAFSLLSAFWLHSRFPHPASFFGWDLGTHLLLIHNLTSEFSIALGNGAFWSLGTEEQLYGLYFVLLLLLTRVPRSRALVVVASVTVLWRVVTPFLPDPGANVGFFHLGSWNLWPFNYWLHWTLGAVAVDAHLGNRRLPAWAASGVLGLIFVIVGLVANQNSFDLVAQTHWADGFGISMQSPEVVVVGKFGELSALAGFFCLMNFALALESTNRLSGVFSRVLAWVGRISYSLYLVHIPIIYTLEQHLPMGDSAVDWPLRYLVYATTVIVAGYLFHQAVERWFLHGRLPGSRFRMFAVSEGGK
jgi:peptidoglycan/LPS O-acetylase OafA/YrhL